MMDAWSRLFLLLVSLCAVLAVDNCVKKGPCSCFNSKGLLDLSPLGNKNNMPRFKDLPGPSGDVYVYSWNPCYDFIEGPAQGPTPANTCNNVAACQSNDQLVFYNLGNQSSSTFTTDSSGVPSVNYIYPIQSRGLAVSSRSAHVKLVCSKATPGSVTVTGEQPSGSGIYYLVYTGVGACQVVPRSSGGLSDGSILCIVFFVLLIIYVVGGVLLQVFHRKASGVEMMPNVGMWEGLGGYIKDGFRFIFCRSKMYGKI